LETTGNLWAQPLLEALFGTTMGNHWTPLETYGFVDATMGCCEIHASISVAEFCNEESNATSDCHCSALAQLLAMDVNVTKSGWKAFVSITASARNHWSWRMGCDAPMLLHSHR